MARPRGASRRRFVLALVVLTALTLITLDTRNGRSGPLGALGRAAHTILSPFQRVGSDVASPVGDWWGGLVDSGKLKRENRSLRRQVTALRSQQEAAQAALHLYAQLKHLAELSDQLFGNAKPITARVIGGNNGNFGSTITIDRGQEVGIEKGMAVVVAEGVVGHVIDAWHGGAEVRLLIDPESAIAVRTISNPANGTAQGHAGGSDLVIDDFDAGTKVKRGDVVITAEVQGSLFPPDLPVGTISSVEVRPAGLGLVVHVTPVVDFESLEFVDVLRWAPGEGPVVSTTTTTTTTPATTTTVPGATTTTTSGTSTSTPGGVTTPSATTSTSTTVVTTTSG